MWYIILVAIIVIISIVFALITRSYCMTTAYLRRQYNWALKKNEDMKEIVIRRDGQMYELEQENIRLKREILDLNKEHDDAILDAARYEAAKKDNINEDDFPFVTDRNVREMIRDGEVFKFPKAEEYLPKDVEIETEVIDASDVEDTKEGDPSNDEN